MSNHRKNKLGPLAFGYTENGITHMKMQWKLLLQVDYSNVIGMNLVNFAFTNEVALAEVMTQMYALYLEAKRHKDENAFIAMVLIEQYMPLLEQNYYVSVYLMWYIEFLLHGEVDPRVFTKIVGIDKELFQLLKVQDDPEAVEILKYKLIPSICRCYEAKKGLVEVTLKAVWEEHQTDGLEPLERYYNLKLPTTQPHRKQGASRAMSEMIASRRRQQGLKLLRKPGKKGFHQHFNLFIVGMKKSSRILSSIAARINCMEREKVMSASSSTTNMNSSPEGASIYGLSVPVPA